MTREEAKKYVDSGLFRAYAEGKQLQYKLAQNSEWRDTPYFDSQDIYPTIEYRIKPEPKLRPWKPEEVPIGAIVRAKNRTAENNNFLIVGRSNRNVYIGHGSSLSYYALLTNYEVTTDGGKTWLPCGVMEEV